MERTECLSIDINCILDLGGHTITCTGGTVATYGNTNVTIQGAGEVVSASGTALDVGGNVTLKGGTFTSGGSRSAGVNVNDGVGSLSVTENVIIQNTGGGYGLAVSNAQSVQLSGGKYSGTAGAIATFNSLTLGGLLAHSGDTRYAYFKDTSTTPLTGVLSDQSLTGTVRVQKCEHDKSVCAYTPNEDADTHAMTCRACGLEGAVEDCQLTYTSNETQHTAACETCGRSRTEAHSYGSWEPQHNGTAVTIRRVCESCKYTKTDGTFTVPAPGQTMQYGTPITLTCTSTLPGATFQWILMSSADMSTVQKSTGASFTPSETLAVGEYRWEAHVNWTGSDGKTMPKSGYLSVLPAPLSNVNVTLSPANAVYNGTVQKPAVAIDGLTEETDYTVAYTGDFTNAGTHTVTVTGKGNYEGEVTKTFTIEKAALTIKANDQAITYGGSITTDADQTTATGLASGDTLASVTLTPSTSNVPGGTIKPTGAVIKRSGEDVTENYTIAYQEGTLTINKAQAAVTDNPTANTLTYTGAAQALVTAGTASVGKVVYSLTETGTYSTTIPTGTDAGSYTVWYKVEGTTNYEGTALASVDVTIAQATAPTPQTGTLNVQNGYAREYTYDLSRLLPVLASGQSFGGEVTYALKTVNITEEGYYESGTAVISGTTLTLPIKAVTSSTEGQIGTITVTLSSKNFADVDATINVNRVNKQPVSIEGVTAQNGTYNGGTHNGYTGTPTASPYNGGFTTTYATAGGTALSGPPTNVGDYTVTISLNTNDTYTGSRTLSFTISKASITIRADDKRADVGTAKPVLTYTVTGLVSGDTLATAPTLACNADMNTIGQYPITASGAAVPSGGNYNTAITYVPGTLNVTDPTIPVTGVTLNKTSTTLTVGGSERLTATVTPGNAIDKSVTWASSNTSVATVDASGNITAVSAGTATIIVTTADGGKTATCTVTVRSNSGGGGGYVPSPNNPSSSTVTVPVSGDQNTVHVSASVSGSTATVSKIDTTQINNVIGDSVKTGMVEIDFTGLGKTIDTVKLPAAPVGEIAAAAQSPANDVRGLTIKLTTGEIAFDGKALAALYAQAGSQITLTVTPARAADLNNRQREAVGNSPVFDLTLRSSSGAITDFRGGYATVSLPYTLTAGQNPSGVVVYYLDSTGNITPCATMYDVRSKTASILCSILQNALIWDIKTFI